MNIAIAFSTKDRPEQAMRVAERLWNSAAGNYDLMWQDGSDTQAGKDLPYKFMLGQPGETRGAGWEFVKDVRGGPDRAFVHAITALLNHPSQYTHVGLCEDDVLLEPGWFGPTMALFDRGWADGLEVGAVSARAYEDRVLIQRDGYAVMHNLGWGHVIFTREAAELTLQHYRTGWTSENRRGFCALTGKDIGKYWAFRAGEHWICSDWGNDAMLAQHGLAALALTPSPCEMIGQDPPLEKQGLRVVKRSVDIHRDDRVFDTFVGRLMQVRGGALSVASRPYIFRLDDGGYFYFAHQLAALGATWCGKWEMNWNLGFGPFAWRAGEGAELRVDLAGPVEVLIGGGESGGKALIRDDASGYEIEPALPAAKKEGDQMFAACVVPANVSYRTIVVSSITPGCIIYGVKAKEPQPMDPRWRFDASKLPPVEAKASSGKILEKVT
jgi:hypothetical protein